MDTRRTSKWIKLIIGFNSKLFFFSDEEGSEERMDSFPSGLRTPNRLEPGSANSSYGNMFGLVERRKRLR